MFAFLRFFHHVILLKDLSNEIDLTSVYKEINKSSLVNTTGNLITADKNFLDNNEDLLSIKFKLQQEAESFLKNAYHLDNRDFTNLPLTNSWVNISRKGQYHHEHEHPFSVVSGVFFLDDCLSNFNFHVKCVPPSIPYFIARGSSTASLLTLIEQNNISKDNIRNNLKNYAIFFLSNTIHYVTPILEDEVRRTLSFNTFFKGRTGNRYEELSYKDY